MFLYYNIHLQTEKLREVKAFEDKFGASLESLMLNWLTAEHKRF